MHIHPTRAQLERLGAAEADGPVVMLNLLRYLPDGGAERYATYAREVQPFLTAVGGRVVWQGSADGVVIGDDDADAWDAVLLVEYPSREAFLRMATDEGYLEVSKHRTAALADSRLVACTARR